MELPIQLKFFRKLELYQELNDENSRAKNIRSDLKRFWEMEKGFLKIVDIKHHRKGKVLEKGDIQWILIKAGFSKETAHDEWTEIIRSLASREFIKFASAYNDPEKGIAVTKEGFLMGRVINDIEEGKKWPRIKYNLLYWLVWLSAIFGALFIIGKFMEFLYPYLKFLKFIS